MPHLLEVQFRLLSVIVRLCGDGASSVEAVKDVTCFEARVTIKIGGQSSR
jgi:hypothetical protein